MRPTTAPIYEPRGLVHAVVHVGTARIYYQRAGRGAPVILLRTATAAAPATTELFAALAEHFRVIVPESVVDPSRDAELPIGTWARDFLDGLGLRRAHLVADEPCAAEALWLALSEPERIGRLAIVLPDADPALPGGLPEDRFELSRQHVLVARIPDEPGEAAGAAERARLIEFLKGEP